MAKSIAETVNFAEAVEKKAYEKKAQQVDTFVQSETAEQKLARSGKMQTAKAIEALAGLGQTSLDLEAQEKKANVEKLQAQIVELTTDTLAEGDKAGIEWSKTQKYLDLPELIKIDIAQRAGDRIHNDKVNKFKAELAADATIIEDEERYQNLVDSVFNMEARELTDPYTAISVSRENERARIFLDEQRIEHNKAMDAKLVKERVSDFTIVINDHVDGYSRENYESDEAFVRDVWKGIADGEATWNKTNGLKGSQTNAAIQDALLKYAQDHDLPELINNDYIPKQYRSGEFDSYAEQERQSLIGKLSTKAIQKANLERIEREAHEREMDDEAYALHEEIGYIDIDDPQYADKDKQWKAAARKYNNLFLSPSYNYGKIGNLEVMQENIMRAVADGAPLVDIKGRIVKIDNLDLVSLTKYVRGTSDLTPDQKKALIPNLTNIISMNSLDKSLVMEQGSVYVNDYIKTYYVDNTGDRASDLYRKIAKEEWQKEQFLLRKENPNANVAYNDDALYRVKEAALARWENHPLIKGGDDKGIGHADRLKKMREDREKDLGGITDLTAPPLPDEFLDSYWKAYEKDPDYANKLVTDKGYQIPTKK